MPGHSLKCCYFFRKHIKGNGVRLKSLRPTDSLGSHCVTVCSTLFMSKNPYTSCLWRQELIVGITNNKLSLKKSQQSNHSNVYFHCRPILCLIKHSHTFVISLFGCNSMLHTNVQHGYLSNMLNTFVKYFFVLFVPPKIRLVQLLAIGEPVPHLL